MYLMKNLLSNILNQSQMTLTFAGVLCLLVMYFVSNSVSLKLMQLEENGIINGKKEADIPSNPERLPMTTVNSMSSNAF